MRSSPVVRDMVYAAYDQAVGAVGRDGIGWDPRMWVRGCDDGFRGWGEVFMHWPTQLPTTYHIQVCFLPISSISTIPSNWWFFIKNKPEVLLLAPKKEASRFVAPRKPPHRLPSYRWATHEELDRDLDGCMHQPRDHVEASHWKGLIGLVFVRLLAVIGGFQGFFKDLYT